MGAWYCKRNYENDILKDFVKKYTGYLYSLLNSPTFSIFACQANFQAVYRPTLLHELDWSRLWNWDFLLLSRDKVLRKNVAKRERENEKDKDELSSRNLQSQIR